MYQIKNYRKRFYTLMESEIGDVKPISDISDEETLIAKIGNSEQLTAKIEKLIDNMSSEELTNIKTNLENIGISNDSDASDIKNVVDDLVNDHKTEFNEETELGDEEKKKETKKLVSQLLLGFGLMNFAIAGLPFQAIYDLVVPNFTESASEAASIITSVLLTGLSAVVWPKSKK